MDYVNYLAATTIQSVARTYLCHLDYIHNYHTPTAIQKVQPTSNYNPIWNARRPVPYHDGPLSSTAQYDCLLDIILPQGSIYKIFSAPDS